MYRRTSSIGCSSAASTANCLHSGVGNQHSVRAREFSQRTRSFLFACLGLVIARMSGKDRFSFYENGIVSINPPMAGDVIGGRQRAPPIPRCCAIEDVVLHAARPFNLDPVPLFKWLTKKEVTLKIHEAALADLLAMTNSCTRPLMSDKKTKHCGVCSQCIDRRFAILAAESSNLSLQRITCASFSSPTVALMTRCDGVGPCVVFSESRRDSEERFLVDFPEMVSALDKFPELTADQAGDCLMISPGDTPGGGRVIGGAAGGRFSTVRDALPAGSLLAICSSRGHVGCVLAAIDTTRQRRHSSTD